MNSRSRAEDGYRDHHPARGISNKTAVTRRKTAITKIEQMGLDLYNALRGPLSRMETTEQMDKFKIELKYTKEIITECMKCAQI